LKELIFDYIYNIFVSFKKCNMLPKVSELQLITCFIVREHTHNKVAWKFSVYHLHKLRTTLFLQSFPFSPQKWKPQSNITFIFLGYLWRSQYFNGLWSISTGEYACNNCGELRDFGDLWFVEYYLGLDKRHKIRQRPTCSTMNTMGASSLSHPKRSW